MAERTDTEMLDWLCRENNWLKLTEPNRKAISAAMDAAEQGLEDRAWKALRERDWALHFYRVSGKWKVYSDGIAIGNDSHLHSTRSAAVIAAYKASGGT